MLENLLSSKIIIGSIIACGLIIIGALIQTPQKRSDTPKTTSEVREKVASESPQLDKGVLKTTRGWNRSKITKQPRTSPVSTQIEPQDSFQQLESELRQLSLKEIVARLEDMKLEDVRYLGKNAQWFRTLIEEESRTLSTEEHIVMETVFRASLGGEWKGEYEKDFGLPAPPP